MHRHERINSGHECGEFDQESAYGALLIWDSTVMRCCSR